MTPLLSGTDMDVEPQTTLDLMKQAGLVGGGGIVSIVIGYLALVKTSLVTRPKTIAEQAAYIEKLHNQLNAQAQQVAMHEQQFVEMRQYIKELRSELAAYRGIPTVEIPQPDGFK